MPRPLRAGIKLLTTAALAQADVPQPEVRVAFTAESALRAIEEFGYPVVLKPVVGSWGRLLARINDRDAAEAILEHKETLGSYQHGIFYIQQFIKKPGRDIRAFVVATRRSARSTGRRSTGSPTRTRRAGEQLPRDAGVGRLCRRTAAAVGGGVLAIDVLEDPDRGFLVNEVNHTMEFRNSIHTTGVDIPGRVVEYVLRVRVPLTPWRSASHGPRTTHHSTQHAARAERLPHDRPRPRLHRRRFRLWRRGAAAPPARTSSGRNRSGYV